MSISTEPNSSLSEAKSYPLSASHAQESETKVLAELTKQASFACIAPKILKGLQGMSCPENDVIQRLGENVRALQDVFVDLFYKIVADMNVDMSYKVVLRLDKKFFLCVEGDHPNKEKISEALGSEPYISSLFAEIASQSAVLRNLQNICNMLTLSKPVEILGNRLLPPAETKYQVSLKGEMNHFYFIQSA